MSPRSIERMTSNGFILGGIFVAGWTLISPCCSFAGAEHGASTQWVIAHTSHYLAALCMLFGILGLCVQRLTQAGKFETIALLGFTFSMWIYGGTGAITSRVWPMIAEHAGFIVEPTGPMFKPIPEPLQVIAVPALAFGVAALGLAMHKAGLFPRAGLMVLLLGAAFFMVPTPPLAPLPWFFFPAAGAVTGLGLVWLGFSLRGGAAPAAFRAESAPRPAGDPVPV
ncbi:MAG TPA: hypothetical protein VFX98_00300 [Longimicrobiaceae bacterium]|nr:hypothetical protein [Longimicrobiaceae bacterium]